MKLDDTTKVVSIVSVVVGLMISVAGYFTNLKIQSLQESVSKLNVADKEMDVAKKAYDLSARLTADFSVPLARSFALQYSAEKPGKGEMARHISMPTSALAAEFAKVLGGWESRRGLMTGKACQQEGLKARQVVTLILKNIGHADAVDITLHVKQKASPHKEPTQSWQELSNTGTQLAYYDLLTATTGWTDETIALSSLRGLGSPAEDRVTEQVVLASVSGTTSLFGTVLVPVEISWTDNISKSRQSLPLLRAQAATLRADLVGAEIGSLGSICP